MHMNIETKYQYKTGLNEYQFQDGQFFYLYIPQKATIQNGSSQLLALIHGYTAREPGMRSRRIIKKNVILWKNYADDMGWVILAPHFDRRRFGNDYQRLNFAGIRSDARLNELIDKAGNILPDLQTEKILLFGHSGGGQFVHRYAAFHSQRLDRAVAGAPGWFMWPDLSLAYPYGARSNGSFNDSYRHLAGLCDQQLLILVGENDDTQRVFRNKYKGIDLNMLQGKGRRRRAENWFFALQEFAIQERLPIRVRLKIIPKTAHRLGSRMVDAAMAWLSA
jgi:pimeloyl-ACP methyl ester carboxylesterase